MLDGLRRRLKTIAIVSPGRDREQQPDRIVESLGLQPGQRVADLGSGSGYFTFRLAAAVAPGGLVYAVDTDADMRAMVEERAAREGAAVTPVASADGALELPDRVDLIFLSHSYHHLPDPGAYLGGAREQLTETGRVAIVEGRPKGIFHRLFGHATDQAVIRSQMTDAGYRLLAVHDFLRNDSFQVFGK
jgi:ubiquinone/menaquinone biosynthesis C-methylase UbiE